VGFLQFDAEKQAIFDEGDTQRKKKDRGENKEKMRG
jgi:hypothetical protein